MVHFNGETILLVNEAQVRDLIHCRPISSPEPHRSRLGWGHTPKWGHRSRGAMFFLLLFWQSRSSYVCFNLKPVALLVRARHSLISALIPKFLCPSWIFWHLLIHYRSHDRGCWLLCSQQEKKKNVFTPSDSNLNTQVPFRVSFSFHDHRRGFHCKIYLIREDGKESENYMKRRKHTFQS